jgi:hypothetical protein
MVSQKPTHTGNDANTVRTGHHQAKNAFHSGLLQGLEFAEKKAILTEWAMIYDVPSFDDTGYYLTIWRVDH